MNQLIEIGWVQRTDPLDACGLTASGLTATLLAKKLAGLTDERLKPLSAVAGADLIVVTGPRESLPWVDGVRYLGRDPEAPSLLMTTTVAPSLPVALIRDALSHAGYAGLIAITDPTTLVSLEGALPLDRKTLERWIATQETTP